ncbi:hypothetical protein NRV55_000326 [Staphylococcus pseudintermedius]|uniref:hypothetical protein n=1 Tax=Staphylococcus pseudintermedius TaxID=283734 RepID=UPI00143F222F|nr:hypothetical protein [Staphylococcus pseudintermedius]EGQ3407840.1 hypothetical protein [Staphylococcus pseudintermedius]EHT8056066.1 hypothetical protein [Staphylococcus pseudintermedius]EJD8533366.1 hypothetical protein [Staphylococcus pseudintermedius]EJN7321771.1 hypothetical protein [Staphylococcus pseudintermedius]NKM73730.1 hypothetical protein [Staphylococcus pseudintermedius]
MQYKSNSESFLVIEISKDDFGHEYEAVYEGCNDEKEAIRVSDTLNKSNATQDNDDYYIVVKSTDFKEGMRCSLN